MTFAKHAGAALLGIALLASPAWADPTETAKAVGKDASWLFIQTGENVQYDGKTLTLSGVSPSVIIFTDRPARLAEAIPTATILTNWDQGGRKNFQSNPHDGSHMPRRSPSIGLGGGTDRAT